MAIIMVIVMVIIIVMAMNTAWMTPNKSIYLNIALKGKLYQWDKGMKDVHIMLTKGLRTEPHLGVIFDVPY